jgi:hypothetical protein
MITAKVKDDAHSLIELLILTQGFFFSYKKKIGLAAKMEEDNRHVQVSPNITPGLEDMIEEVPDTDDQPPVPHQGAADDDMREDAASETGTDDSGLVMALDQDSVTGQRDENNPSNNNLGVGHLNAGFSVGGIAKTSERTRSTISEDKAAVSFLIKIFF